MANGNRKSSPLVTVTSAALLLLLGISHTATRVRADALITPEECYKINPNPTFQSCAQYTEPYSDLFTPLPYDTVPAYRQCVRERCVCSGQQPSLEGTWTTSGMQCSATGGWNETGALACNAMVECFKKFWECVGDALMGRYVEMQGTGLTAAELALVNDTVQHGHTPGQDFETTDTFLSCRMIQCEAAATRKNCGLITCIPNNTQCYEYIKPPPLPDVHQLCTQGCRAVLVLMALTLTIFFSAMCCCACCPAVVIENEPLITGEGDNEGDDEGDDEGGNRKKNRRRGSDAPGSNLDIQSQQQRGDPNSNDGERDSRN